MENNIKRIILLSTSNIKIKAVKEIFSDYEIISVEIPENNNRPTQPIHLNEIRSACNSRIEDAIDDVLPNLNLSKYSETYIISIENGLSTLDYEPKFEDRHWCDICMIGVVKINDLLTRNFYISPCVIHIEKKYTKKYFERYFPKHSHYQNNKKLYDEDYYDASDEDLKIDTLGKYIAYTHNNKIPHNNWMCHLYDIDRVFQIKMGLLQVKEELSQK
jgi:hypothetical protein